MDFKRNKGIRDRILWRCSYLAKRLIRAVFGESNSTKWLLDASWVMGRLAFEASGEMFGNEFHNDSLATNPKILSTIIPGKSSVIDIGCGGGFPCVPLAIFFPDVQFLAVDSIAKKLKVVDAVCEMAGIKNITTKHTRAEEIKNKKFDYAISRAVAPLKDLWRWAGPLLIKKANQPNGLICLKGGDLHQEIFESGVRPKMMSIYDIFPEEYFQEKFIIQVKKP
mgnify:CR=1 FL=1